MEEETKNILNLVLRYVILVLVAVPNLYLFYKLFTPITIQAVYYSLKIFFDVSISGNAISFNPSCLSIEIIEACIAGSAYYLLLLFNLSTPNIEFKKRIWLILAAFSSFFVLNIVRIFVLSVLLLNRSSFFDFSHRLSWYVISTLMVVIIWFAEVKFFKIKDIPVYSDINYLLLKTNLTDK